VSFAAAGQTMWLFEVNLIAWGQFGYALVVGIVALVLVPSNQAVYWAMNAMGATLIVADLYCRLNREEEEQSLFDRTGGRFGICPIWLFGFVWVGMNLTGIFK